MATHFIIDGLKAAIEGKEIFKGSALKSKAEKFMRSWDRTVQVKVHLASALMGHPKYEVTEGSVTFGW